MIKYVAPKLNNYQYGAYPFNTLHQYITKEEKLDKSHRTVYLEVPDDMEKWIKFVNEHIAGCYWKKEFIKKVEGN